MYNLAVAMVIIPLAVIGFAAYLDITELLSMAGYKLAKKAADILSLITATVRARSLRRLARQMLEEASQISDATQRAIEEAKAYVIAHSADEAVEEAKARVKANNIITWRLWK